MSKISNTLGILYYLNNRYPSIISGDELASRFEVDKREIRRYIYDLTLAGFQIQTKTGPSGGYSLHRKLKLPLSLSKTEVLLLNLQINCNQEFINNLNDSLGVFGELDKDLMIQAEEIDNHTLSIIYSISLAIKERKEISFKYNRYNSDLVYIVKPYQLRRDNEVIRLIGLHDNIMKQFRISNILSLNIINDSSFEYDNNLLNEYLKKDDNIFGISRSNNIHNVEAKVKGRSIEYLNEFFNYSFTIYEKIDNMNFSIKFNTCSVSEAVYALLSLGGCIRILGDADIKKKYLQELKRMKEMNFE